MSNPPVSLKIVSIDFYGRLDTLGAVLFLVFKRYSRKVKLFPPYPPEANKFLH